jgi:hypothetical protein
MAFRPVHPAWLDQTSSSPSIDSSSNAWKRASGNSSKSLIAIQRSMESYGLSTRPSRLAQPDLIITEHRSLIHCMEKFIRKLLSKFDRDPTVGLKVMAFRPVHPAWLDQTSLSPSIDSSSNAWNRASGNSSKSLIAIQRSDRKLWPFEPSNQPGSTRPHHHRVSIHHPMRGKGHTETPVKV